MPGALRSVGKGGGEGAQGPAPLTTSMKALPFFPCNGLARMAALLQTYPGEFAMRVVLDVLMHDLGALLGFRVYSRLQVQKNPEP